MKTKLLALALLLAPAAALAQYEAQFGENKIVYDKFDWKTYRSTHFTIYFYERERGSLQKVASYAESAYDDISRQLNFQIPKPINLIYYATHSDFEQTNTLLNFIPEGIGAFALPSRNRMVLPIDLPDEKLQQLIAHELTHVFQFEILFGGNYLRAATTNAPQWFLEGMASYFGNDEDNKDRMVLRDAVLADQVPEIAQRGIQGFFAYRFGHAVFDFIAAEWGKDAVREFLFEFRNQIGGNLDKPIKRSFNISAEDFDIKFRRFLRQRYLKILTEKGEPIDFGERFKIEDTPSAETSPRAYPSGDFVAAISTYKDEADVVLMSTRERKLYRNLTKGYTTAYEYLVSQWVTTGPQSGADLSVSPDGNTVAVFARRERGRDLLLLNALNGGIRERIEMPGLDQQLSPAFSPDARTIVFRALRDGKADIYAYDVASRAITNLTRDDESSDFGPAFSPDGKWIYYSSVRGTTAKIFRLHADAPDSREQVTYGAGNDEDPTLSPDGKRVFFTSDRDQGIYNIYSVNLETGETAPPHQRRGGRLFPDRLHRARQHRKAHLLRLLQAALHALHRRHEQAGQAPARARTRPRARACSPRPRPTSPRSRSRWTRRRSPPNRARSCSSRTRRSRPASTRTRPSSPTPCSSSGTTWGTAASSPSSSRSRRSRTSSSATSTSPSVCRKGSRSSTTGLTSWRWTNPRARTRSCATGARTARPGD